MAALTDYCSSHASESASRVTLRSIFRETRRNRKVSGHDQVPHDLLSITDVAQVSAHAEHHALLSTWSSRTHQALP